MAKIINIAEVARNLMLDALGELLNGGSCEIYSGSMPANPETAPGVGNTLLATLTFDDPAAAPAAGGVLTFATIQRDDAADATATATWARLKDLLGDPVMDLNVGSGGNAAINFNTAALVLGGPVEIVSGTISIPSSISF